MIEAFVILMFIKYVSTIFEIYLHLVSLIVNQLAIEIVF